MVYPFKDMKKILFTIIFFAAILSSVTFSCDDFQFPGLTGITDDNTDDSSTSDGETDDDSSVPNAVSGLSVESTSIDSIVLLWADNSDDEDGFIVEQSLMETEAFTEAADLSSNIETVVISGLSQDTEYFFRVYAYNANGDSSYSAVVSGTTLQELSTPNSPSELMVTGESSSTVSLSWTDNSDNEDGFIIEMSETGLESSYSEAADTTADSVIITGLEAETEYFFRVYAYKSTDNSDYSNVISAETDTAGTINTSAPDTTERLVFIHHSCGSNWLGTGNGNLGDTLGSNNYFVRDITYNWDEAEPGGVETGDYTDTRHWTEYWFNDTTMPAVYITESKYASYTSISNPSGENDIIMFKSCYPNSEVYSSITDEKAYYNQLLDYFVLHQDKLFILITPPGEAVVSSYLLTQELCEWLVDEENGWLKDYAGNNVGVFDFYCVLSETDSHHTIENGSIVYEYAAEYDGISPYHDGDDHPNIIGNQKSTDEFIPLLNYYRNRWRGVE